MFTEEFPEPLTGWDVIPTWTFEDPISEAIEDSASIRGTVNDAGNGQIANNPNKELYGAVYDSVMVPAAVKDDYDYRDPYIERTELLMRFSGLNSGSYNVTVFEGRTTDNNGRFGKVWVDSTVVSNAPAKQNTGNYVVVVEIDGAPIIAPDGQSRTVTVDLAEGQHIWFAEMEDNSGGISGIAKDSVTDGGSISSISLTDKNIVIEFDGPLMSADSIDSPFNAVDGATSPHSVTPDQASQFLSQNKTA